MRLRPLLELNWALSDAPGRSILRLCGRQSLDREHRAVRQRDSQGRSGEHVGDVVHTEHNPATATQAAQKPNPGIASG